MHRTVIGRTKRNTIVVNIRIQRKNLKASGVGQSQTLPTCERTETAKVCNNLSTRTQHQVIGVTQNNSGSEFFIILCTQVTNCTPSANRHETWCLVFAAMRCSNSGTRRILYRSLAKFNSKHRATRYLTDGYLKLSLTETTNDDSTALHPQTKACDNARQSRSNTGLATLVQQMLRSSSTKLYEAYENLSEVSPRL